MSILLVISTILISCALIFYSIGVWAEKLSHYLKPWHLVAFWTGLAFDFSGTLTMHIMAKDPFDFFEPHTMTGQLALFLMLVHAVWAIYVVYRGSESSKKKFHRYSIIVWLIWLIPYFGGMYIGMKG
jgi:uncharacterized repeat protein (TIGR03987 family)